MKDQPILHGPEIDVTSLTEDQAKLILAIVINSEGHWSGDIHKTVELVTRNYPAAGT